MVSNDWEWSFGDWMIYSLSHHCSIRGNNKRLLFVFLSIGCEGWREENSHIMKLWSSFLLSQKRSLSSSYYKYIIKIEYILHCGPFYLLFSYFPGKFLFFPSLLKKILHEYVRIIKYSNVTEITDWKAKVSLHRPCPTPSPNIQPLQKSSFFFLNLYYPRLGQFCQFHNNRWHIQSTGKFQNIDNWESLKMNPPMKYSPRKWQGKWWQSGWTETRVAPRGEKKAHEARNIWVCFSPCH